MIFSKKFEFSKKLTSNFWVFLGFLWSLGGRNGFSRSRSIGSTPGIMGIPWFFMKHEDFLITGAMSWGGVHKLQRFIEEKYNEFSKILKKKSA